MKEMRRDEDLGLNLRTPGPSFDFQNHAAVSFAAL